MNFTITDCVGEEVYWKMAGQKNSKLNLLIGTKVNSHTFLLVSEQVWNQVDRQVEMQIRRQFIPVQNTIKQKIRK